MANFETSYMLTNLQEGGYANDKDDKGGETYRGIARKFHPGWEGWKIIDEAKNKTKDIKELNNILDENEQLQLLIKNFYRVEFWNKIKGDELQYQSLANELYDNAVNMGVSKSIEYLQRTLNILNKNQLSYNDIAVDSMMGIKTIVALSACIKAHGIKRVVNVLNGYQVKHYIELMEKNPSQEKFVGWFDRVEIVWNN
ncbi:MAG: hypothetical protein GYA14_14900 [Ignavibacteria bacterium]|nr:hypothetical protein [Ignavibacteria bacterium]